VGLWVNLVMGTLYCLIWSMVVLFVLCCIVLFEQQVMSALLALETIVEGLVKKVDNVDKRVSSLLHTTRKGNFSSFTVLCSYYD